MPGGATIGVRDARLEDSGRLAELATQLGYPTTAQEVGKRLARYEGSADERVIVAVDEGKVVGWTSAAIVDHFYLARYVEISGLIVDADSRNRGIGALLIAEVERWAAERNLGLVRLRANVVRVDAHRFYERQGFTRTKTQYTFEKPVGR
ncbi:MAG: GNAT family N-acetyltransferase [Spirochaetes bacterium]|nr:GNAT family N-acetyltransferase [Spirochaetota bacterium]